VGAALIIAMAGLSGCGSDDASSSASSSAAVPSPTPTPAPIVWADGVCEARDNLNAAVSALGRNLSYDVSSDRSALEQIDRQLRVQVLSVGNALQVLGTELQAVPVDFQQANDFVVSATKAKDDTSEAVATAQEHLDAMLAADDILTGVAEAGKALVAGKAAFEAGTALVGVVRDGVSGANEEVQAAFAAAPACQSDSS
jgi:hypothetical protein